MLVNIIYKKLQGSNWLRKVITFEISTVNLPVFKWFSIIRA